MKKTVTFALLVLPAFAHAQATHASAVVPESASMPPSSSETVNIYAGTAAGHLSEEARRAKPMIYVPEGGAGSVALISPTTYKVVHSFLTGVLPQHVVPSYDLKTLWVLNENSNTVTPIDPVTGTPGKSVSVIEPYNLYFTPDGHFAISVAERHQRLDFRDPHTMELKDTVAVQCPGVDHMDFTTDGRYAIATCEFSGQLLKLDLQEHKVVGYLVLDPQGLGFHGSPQDIRSSPDGRVFYVADIRADGVYLVDPVEFKRIGFIPTGEGAHGIYPSRDGKLFYVTNRGSHEFWGTPHGTGTIVVLDPATRTIVARWEIEGGGSPDMGNVSEDGKELWVSGRFDGEVYVFDTSTGKMTHRIKVDRGPHGLTVWPQPGTYSLGHTGNMR